MLVDLVLFLGLALVVELPLMVLRALVLVGVVALLLRRVLLLDRVLEGLFLLMVPIMDRLPTLKLENVPENTVCSLSMCRATRVLWSRRLVTCRRMLLSLPPVVL